MNPFASNFNNSRGGTPRSEDVYPSYGGMMLPGSRSLSSYRNSLNGVESPYNHSFPTMAPSWTSSDLGSGVLSALPVQHEANNICCGELMNCSDIKRFRVWNPFHLVNDVNLLSKGEQITHLGNDGKKKYLSMSREAINENYVVSRNNSVALAEKGDILFHVTKKMQVVNAAGTKTEVTFRSEYARCCLNGLERRSFVEKESNRKIELGIRFAGICVENQRHFLDNGFGIEHSPYVSLNAQTNGGIGLYKNNTQVTIKKGCFLQLKIPQYVEKSPVRGKITPIIVPRSHVTSEKICSIISNDPSLLKSPEKLSLKISQELIPQNPSIHEDIFAISLGELNPGERGKYMLIHQQEQQRNQQHNETTAMVNIF